MTRKDEKTAQIMAAAVQEFLAKGLDAASMHNIAEVSGVSKRTLYKYYSTKDELYEAIVDELLNQVEDMYKIEFSKKAPIEDQIRTIVENKIELTISDSFLNMSKIVIGEMLKGRTATPEQLEKFNKAEALFVEWIDQAKRHGKVQSEMESTLMADQFHAIMKSQIYWPVLLGFIDVKSININEVRDMTVRFFMDSFCK